MKTVTTGTYQTAEEMAKAVQSGLTFALEFASTERHIGLAVFCKTINDARLAFKKYSKEWEQFRLTLQSNPEDLNDYKELAKGWL